MPRRFLLAAASTALALTFGTPAAAKLPPPSAEAQAKAELAKARAAHADKVGAYQLCVWQNRIAEQYRRDAQAQGKPVRPPTPTPACADPGPFVEPTPPLEQAGAHSPAPTAATPPNTAAPQEPTAQQK
ncbi:hypothetical protein [Caldimonas thermodepolymerans]|uniref:hypothetical protein n=1 Tax=Caldimonas thermodepolymerans TaxID=215580 RepID=UPI0022366074|nr:hypothetical protein [Caldimonas thermodepolymerans]UZG43426.1 hypothetical protein ONZ46_13595 [Caldimonas thermodepolymerans]